MLIEFNSEVMKVEFFPPKLTGGYLQMNLIIRIYYSDNFEILYQITGISVHTQNTIPSEICAKVHLSPSSVRKEEGERHW